MHLVVAAALFRDDQVLLCRRSAGRAWYPGVWDLPGGHVADSEEPADALRRELSEELGIRAQLPPEPDATLHEEDLRLSVWSVRHWSGTPRNLATDEHDEIGWHAVDRLDGLDLAAAAYPDLLNRLRHAQPIRVTRAQLARQRPGEEHFCESLVEQVLDRYTRPGDLVLDPFAGFGTTLEVAERMGRYALGVELDEERVAEMRSRGLEVVHGDTRSLVDELPPAALCLTSPPYMTATDHPENPLTAYETEDGDFDTYVAELGEVFGRLAGKVQRLVVNVADPVDPSGPTALVDAVEAAVLMHVGQVQRVRVEWDDIPSELENDTCLVFGL